MLVHDYPRDPEAKAAGLPGDVVAGDAGYGDDTDYRDGITGLGLPYVLGVRQGTTVWAPGTGPLPPKPWEGRGKKPTRQIGRASCRERV